MKLFDFKVTKSDACIKSSFRKLGHIQLLNSCVIFEIYHIGPPTYPGNSEGGDSNGDDDDGQSTAAIIGETIGGILGMLIMICCISWYCYLWCNSQLIIKYCEVKKVIFLTLLLFQSFGPQLASNSVTLMCFKYCCYFLHNKHYSNALHTTSTYTTYNYLKQNYNYIYIQNNYVNNETDMFSSDPADHSNSVHRSLR